MKVTRRKIENVIEKLETILDLMDEKGLDSVNGRSNTYGIHNDFIGFVGYDGGYLCLNYIIEELENEEYEEEEY